MAEEQEEDENKLIRPQTKICLKSLPLILCNQRNTLLAIEEELEFK